MKRMITPMLWLPFMLIIMGCAKEVTQEELINAAVQLKVEQWRAAQMAECKTNIYLMAEDYVDSLLVAISLEDKLDTIPKPVKPEKPLKPSFRTKPDSVVVDPIYKKEH